MTRARFLVTMSVLAIAAIAVLVIARPDPARADWAQDCSNPTQTFTAANMPTNLNLTAADRVLFSSGTFTGGINTQGATICVDTAAGFNPANLNGSARLFVRGSALLPPLAANAGALLDNEGSVEFLPQVNVNGLATVINRTTGTILVDAPGVALPAGATVTNDGTITVAGFVNLNGSTVTNNATLSITGPLTLSGTFTNTATMTVGGVMTINGGSQVSNTCSLTAAGLINNAALSNAGVIDLVNNAFVQNGGATLTQPASGFMQGGDFTNSGLVSGSGQFLFSGTTNNLGTVAGASSAAPITFFDTTSNGAIFDTNTGTVTNVVRQAVSPPDAGACAATPPTTTTTTTTSTTTSTTTTTTSTLPPEPTTTSSTTTLPPDTTTSTSSTTSTSTTTTSPPDPTTTAASSTTTTSGPTSPTTTTTGSGAGGALPATGTDDTGPALGLAITCALSGAALLLVSRPRRRP